LKDFPETLYELHAIIDLLPPVN